MTSMGRDFTASPRPRQAVSIQHVADLAKVSIATVSRAMNKPHMVSSGTAKRVLDAVEVLGYRPNRFAQALMTRESGVLGIAIPDLHGEFFSELLRGADSEARALGYHVLVSSIHDDLGPKPADGPVRVSRALGLIDGLVAMITEPSSVLATQLDAMGVPLVMIGADADQSNGHDTVSVDHAHGARQACEHLLTGADPASCYFVGGPSRNYDTLKRANAFRRFLESRGHTLREDQVRFHDYSIEWGSAWAQEMIERDALRDARVFCANDEIACGVLRVGRDAGIDVPGELKIVGYDGTRLGELVRPRLSTVAVPVDELGRTAVRLLIERLSEPEITTRHVVLKPMLMIHQSSSR